jgi:hypothetical protein
MKFWMCAIGGGARCGSSGMRHRYIICVYDPPVDDWVVRQSWRVIIGSLNNILG